MQPSSLQPITLHESEWYHLTRVGPGALRLVRTARAFDTLAEMERALVPLLAELESLRPRAMLVDLRQAPPRNDPAFETAFTRYRRRMSRAATEAALLLRSQVGRLQVQRLAREDGVELTIFDDEAAATRWLVERGDPRVWR